VVNFIIFISKDDQKIPVIIMLSFFFKIKKQFIKLQKFTPKNIGMDIKVKLIINELLPIIEHFFFLFFSFFNQIEQFLCDWVHKLEGYKCSLNIINNTSM